MNSKFFSQRIIATEAFETNSIADASLYFHMRYQDSKLYDNLMHKDSSTKMKGLLQQPFGALSHEDCVFLVAFTVYRYRNNIFHGNKGIRTWLKFKPQIERCIEVMKTFINHSESVAPSLRISTVAH